MKKLIYLFFAFSIFLFSCQEDKDVNKDPYQYETLEHFYTQASVLKVEIAYEPNAEPYVSGGFGSSVNFDFTQNNLTALFAQRSRPIQVLIDKQLNQMTQIPSQNKTSFTSADIRDLSDDYQVEQSTEDQTVVFLVFLDGYYSLNGQNQNTVLGFSAGSHAVAIFKPVLEAITGGGVLGSNPKYQVEQATIVHEVAHAIGLVNAGVDMHVAHQDAAHGKHCSNTDCVMYWTNEGPSGASGLFGGASVNEIVFGQECIDDITNYLN
ncbi:MAG: hypothetical protein R2772_11195 [Chitinophagales bacterium]